MSDYPNHQNPKISGEFSTGVAATFIVILMIVLGAAVLAVVCT